MQLVQQMGSNSWWCGGQTDPRSQLFNSKLCSRTVRKSGFRVSGRPMTGVMSLSG